MTLTLALDDLERMARSPTEAIAAFVGRGRSRSWAVFRERHLPLLVFYPLAGLLCPYSYVFGRGPNFAMHVLVPFTLALLALVQAVLFDRILEYESHRTLEVEGEPDHSQLALYLHLPVSAGGLFFFIHPVFGYLLLFAALAYSTTLSLTEQARARNISLARSITAYIKAALLPLLALTTIALLLNVFNTVAILRGLD